MRFPGKWICLAAAGAVIVAVFVWRFRPFADEPVYHGKTVTEWLDGMALFDEVRTADVEGPRPRSPSTLQVVPADPSLTALLAIGSKAVPTLERTLQQEPADESGAEKLSLTGLLEKYVWKTVDPGDDSRLKALLARQSAAALAMIAIGTNQGAGALAALRNCTRSDVMALYHAFAIASRGLPQRHAELVAGVLVGFHDPSPMCQRAAMVAALACHDDRAFWRRPLLDLAESAPSDISLQAFQTLALADPKNPQVMALSISTLTNRSNSLRARKIATVALGRAEEKAAGALPLLRAVAAETNLPRGSGLPEQAKFAIDSIERACAKGGAKR